MKQITSIRKAVCTMGNELRKEGYSLSQAFRKAWKRGHRINIRSWDWSKSAA